MVSNFDVTEYQTASFIRTRTPLSTTTFINLRAEILTHSIADPDETAEHERYSQTANGAFQRRRNNENRQFRFKIAIGIL